MHCHSLAIFAADSGQGNRGSWSLQIAILRGIGRNRHRNRRELHNFGALSFRIHVDYCWKIGHRPQQASIYTSVYVQFSATVTFTAFLRNSSVPPCQCASKIRASSAQSLSKEGREFNSQQNHYQNYSPNCSKLMAAEMAFIRTEFLAVIGRWKISCRRSSDENFGGLRLW